MAYIIIATDYLTKRTEAKAVRIKDAKNIVIFLFENIITKFDCLKILISDRRMHFIKEIIQEIITRFNINHIKTTSYHPKINGQTERINWTLMNILYKIMQDLKRNWNVTLLDILQAYKTTYKVTIKTTPFSLVHGIEVVLSIEFKIPFLHVVINTWMIKT